MQGMWDGIIELLSRLYAQVILIVTGQMAVDPTLAVVGGCLCTGIILVLTAIAVLSVNQPAPAPIIISPPPPQQSPLLLPLFAGFVLLLVIGAIFLISQTLQ